MKHQKLMGKITLPSETECKVLYSKQGDEVEIEMGTTTLRLQANSFIVMHEMLRKAAARIIMQTEHVN